MMIDFACGDCGKTYSVPDSQAGKKGRCKACGEVLLIPLDASVPIDVPSSDSSSSIGSVATARKSPPTPAPAPVAVATVPVQTASGPVQNIQVIVNHVETKSANALGVAAVIVGILACVGGCVPIFGIFATPLVLLGLIFAAVGWLVALTSKRSGSGWPIAGLAVNATAGLIILANVLILGGLGSGFIGSAQSAMARAKAERAQKAQPAPKAKPAVPPAVKPARPNQP